MTARLSETAQAVRAVIAVYDVRDQFAVQPLPDPRRDLPVGLYRREREHYPEWIDHGGEG